MIKGQIFSTDLILSIFIFLFIFAVIVLFVRNMQEQSVQDELRKDLELQATRVSDLFVKSSGLPQNWEELDEDLVNSIGLAKRNWVLDWDKVSAFLAMDYNKSKEIMGVEQYNYFFRLTNQNLTKGFVGGDTRVLIKRIVIDQDIQNTIEFILWR